MSGSIRVSEKHGVNPSVCKCFWCGKDKGVVLFGRMKDDAEAPRSCVVDYDPCDECVSLWSQGIVFFEAEYGGKSEHPPFPGTTFSPTGRFVVVKREAVEDGMLTEPLRSQVLKAGRCVVEPAVFEMFHKPGNTEQ